MATVTTTLSPLTVRAPSEKPLFTLGTLRAAIPQHCFERSVLRSSAYLGLDLAVIAVLYVLSQQIPSEGWLPFVLWPLYWFFQGAFGTGVWVIAHECGHQSFSKWQSVNDGVGLVMHSLLLVPYFSWKHSHRRHHSNTGNMQKDEVFVPETPESLLYPLTSTLPVRLLLIPGMLLAGWPAYLFANASGRKYDTVMVNHFDPYSPIFSKRERGEVLISDVALCIVLAGLYALGRSMGWVWLLQVYGIPYLIVNAWLVTITLLQHTHPALPHYTESEWDWLRGALATVDRSYGFLDHVFHHIADTHVAHHLFSTMPHYHAQEATEVLKKVLGPYYQYDSRPIWKALVTDWLSCAYVEPDTAQSGTMWFKSWSGKPVSMPLKSE